MNFEDNVYSVLNRLSSYVVAVSGGADSMALLSSLYSFTENDHCPLQDRIYVLHVEHGLRGQESKDDAQFVHSFCEERKIPCTVVTIPPGKIAAYAKREGIGIEAAARHFRRRALLREAKRLDENGAQKTFILTAHTKDDALELFLMRVLRGAGPQGLSFMPLKKGSFLRPLLNVSRTDVIAYLKEKNIPWREDSTNADDRFLRNKIRNRLIPLLNENFPSWKKGFLGTAQTQSLAADFLSTETRRHIKWDASNSSLSTGDKNFFSQPQIIREESILCALAPLCGKSLKTIKRTNIRLFSSGCVNAVNLGTVKLRRNNGKIYLSPVEKELFESGTTLLIK